MNKFGITDYINMYKKYGVKLVLFYFKENHFFDIINRVDTHKRVLKKDFPKNITNISDGVLYMASFTSVVTKSIKFIYEQEHDFEHFNLIDIGSGKGKVLLIWKKFLKINKLKNSIYGIEYSKPLSEIAKKNINKKKLNDIQILNNDLSEHIDLFNKKNIYYLFNPFGKKTLTKILKMVSCPTYFIYNNPVHLDVFLNFEYEIISESRGFHPNLNWVIFYKKQLNGGLN